MARKTPKGERTTIKFGTPQSEVTIKLQGMAGYCRKCDSIKPMSEFGFRQMGSGDIRKQAYCKTCRVK